MRETIERWGRFSTRRPWHLIIGDGMPGTRYFTQGQVFVACDPKWGRHLSDITTERPPDATICKNCLRTKRAGLRSAAQEQPTVIGCNALEE